MDDGDENDDDNDSMSMLFKAKMDHDSTFKLTGYAWTYDRKVNEKSIQVSYKTYANGLDVTVV